MEEARIQYFRRKLLETINIPKVNSSGLKLLVENIEITTGEDIGYNTLRRFFGLLPSTKPRNKTWKILQKYLDKKGKTEASIELEYLNQWKTINDLYIFTNSSDESATINHLNKISTDDRFPMILGTLISQLFSSGNISFLNKIFTQTNFFNLTSPQIDFTAQIIFEGVKSMPLKDRAKFKPLFDVDNFREKILYFYIDYSSLNGFYGSLVGALDPQNPQEDLFLKCINGYRSYLNNEKITIIKKLSISELENFYPVLIGRYIGYQLLSYPEETYKIIDYYIPELAKSMEPHLLFVEVFPALIFLKDFRSIQLLINKYYEPMYEMFHWNSYIPYNIFLIAESLMYLYEGNIKRAKSSFEAIKLEYTLTSYHSYVKLFYLILSYQLETNPKEKENITKEYQLLVKNTGFKRFTDDFLVRYFNW